MPGTAPTIHRRWWILAAVSLTQLLMVLDGTIVNVAIPRAQADLGLGDGDRQWIFTAYALAFGSFLLLGGRVADYWGRRRAYLLGLGAFGAASAWGGLTHSAGQLITARGVQGLAAALMAPAALAFVTLCFPDGGERDRAFAIFGSLAGAGSALGMVLGGVLTEFFSWRWCLLVNVPLVVLGLVAGVVLLPESRAEGERRYDVLGALTATLGFGALVYGLTLVERSWTAPTTLLSIAAGLVLIGLFVLVERRSTGPLLPLRILTDRARAASFIVQALVGVSGTGAMLYLGLHLQLVLGLPPLAAGAGTLPFTLALMSTVPLAVRMVGRRGPRRQMVVGPLISATGLVLLALVTVHGSYWVQVLPGLLLLGAGMGLTVVPLNNLALHGVAPQDAGVASATANATNQLGASIGLAGLTVVYVLTARGRTTAAADRVAGHSMVFVLCALVFVACSVVAAWLLRPAGAAVEVVERESGEQSLDAVAPGGASA